MTIYISSVSGAANDANPGTSSAAPKRCASANAIKALLSNGADIRLEGYWNNQDFQISGLSGFQILPYGAGVTLDFRRLLNSGWSHIGSQVWKKTVSGPDSYARIIFGNSAPFAEGTDVAKRVITAASGANLDTKVINVIGSGAFASPNANYAWYWDKATSALYVRSNSTVNDPYVAYGGCWGVDRTYNDPLSQMPFKLVGCTNFNIGALNLLGGFQTIGLDGGSGTISVRATQACHYEPSIVIVGGHTNVTSLTLDTARFAHDRPWFDEYFEMDTTGGDDGNGVKSVSGAEQIQIMGKVDDLRIYSSETEGTSHGQIAMQFFGDFYFGSGAAQQTGSILVRGHKFDCRNAIYGRPFGTFGKRSNVSGTVVFEDFTVDGINVRAQVGSPNTTVRRGVFRDGRDGSVNRADKYTGNNKTRADIGDGVRLYGSDQGEVDNTWVEDCIFYRIYSNPMSSENYSSGYFNSSNAGFRNNWAIAGDQPAKVGFQTGVLYRPETANAPFVAQNNRYSGYTTTRGYINGVFNNYALGAMPNEANTAPMTAAELTKYTAAAKLDSIVASGATATPSAGTTADITYTFKDKSGAAIQDYSDASIADSSPSVSVASWVSAASNGSGQNVLRITGLSSGTSSESPDPLHGHVIAPSVAVTVGAGGGGAVTYDTIVVNNKGDGTDVYTSTTPYEYTLPYTPTAGRRLIVNLACFSWPDPQSAPSISDNQGGANSWSLVASKSHDTAGRGIFQFISGPLQGVAAPFKIRITHSADSGLSFDVMQVSGLETAGGVLGCVRDTGTTSGVATNPQAVATGGGTSKTNDLAVSAITNNTYPGNANLSYPAGWTGNRTQNDGTGALQCYASAYRTVPSDGNITCSWPQNPSEVSDLLISTFKPKANAASITGLSITNSLSGENGTSVLVAVVDQTSTQVSSALATLTTNEPGASINGFSLTHGTTPGSYTATVTLNANGAVQGTKAYTVSAPAPTPTPPLVPVRPTTRTNKRYVNFDTGNNANDGLSFNTAWKDIRSKQASIPADCEVIIKNGTYQPPRSLVDTWSLPAMATGITIRGESDWGVHLRGTASTDGNPFTIGAANDLQIHGIDFVQWDDASGNGAVVMGDSTGVDICGCRFEDLGSAGILDHVLYLGSGASYATAPRNGKFRYNRIVRNASGNAGAGLVHSYAASGYGAHDWEICYNQVYGNFNFGALITGLYPDSRNTTKSNLNIHHNDVRIFGSTAAGILDFYDSSAGTKGGVDETCTVQDNIWVVLNATPPQGTAPVWRLRQMVPAHAPRTDRNVLFQESGAAALADLAQLNMGGGSGDAIVSSMPAWQSFPPFQDVAPAPSPAPAPAPSPSPSPAPAPAPAPSPTPVPVPSVEGSGNVPFGLSGSVGVVGTSTGIGVSTNYSDTMPDFAEGVLQLPVIGQSAKDAVVYGSSDKLYYEPAQLTETGENKAIKAGEKVFVRKTGA